MWVLGGLVSGGGEREQGRSLEGPPLESDEKCCRLHCCGVRGLGYSLAAPARLRPLVILIKAV